MKMMEIYTYVYINNKVMSNREGNKRLVREEEVEKGGLRKKR